MNCATAQNQIIALPDPRQLSVALRDHVLSCDACRAWASQAARLEALLTQLSVPPAPAEKKEAMIGDLMSADPVIQPMPTPAARPSFATVAGRFLRQNATYVGGLAAAVLVAVGVAWYMNRPVQVTPEFVERQDHPLLKKMVARNVEMARAETPAKRLEVLGGMADEIAGETRGVARVASPAELIELANWYDKVVKDGLVKQSKDLKDSSAPERKRLLDPLAAKLNADADAAEKLAGEAPPDAQPTLKRMADTAREGARELKGK